MRTSLLALAIALVLGTTQTAQAYLPPGGFLLEMLVDKRQKQKIHDITVQLSAQIAGTSSTVDERLYIKSDDRLRLVQQLDDEERVLVNVGNRQASGTEGALRMEKAPYPELLPLLFAPNTDNTAQATARLLAALKAAHIDTTVVSLGRLDREVAYIIGARPWETERPQLWLYKSTLLPMRIVLFDGTNELDIRMQHYGGPANGDWFPGVVEVRRNDEVVRMAETTKVQLNQDLPETLFQLPRG